MMRPDPSDYESPAWPIPLLLFIVGLVWLAWKFGWI